MLVNISDGYLRQLASGPEENNPFLDDVHANDMGWGLCAASSRALRRVPGLDAPVMVPLIDFAQHAVDPSCHVADYRVGWGVGVYRAATHTISVSHNHKHNRITHDTLQSSGGAVQLVASRDIKAGELLTLSYGNLTNAELLLDYG